MSQLLRRCTTAALACFSGYLLHPTQATARAQAPTQAAAPLPNAAPAASDVASSGSIDPKARALINQMVMAYRSLKSYSGNVLVRGTGQPGLFPLNATITVKKPNQIAIVVTKKQDTTRILSDGTHLFTLSSREKTHFVKMAAPDGAEALPRVIALSGVAGAGALPILLAGQNPLAPSEQFLKSLSVSQAGTAGNTPVETVEAQFEGPQGKATFMFVIGKEDCLLRQMTITQTMGGQSSSFVETHTDVKANPNLSEAAFVFVPPPGAKEVASPGVPKYNPRLEPGAAPPSFQVKDREGKLIRLDQFQGKVVLLNFWATWCDGCIKELPFLLAAHDRFKNLGFEVINISLDQAEDRDKLTTFLHKNKLPGRQVYEGRSWQSEVADLYGVRSVPFTVILGRDGIIASDVRGVKLEPAIQAALAKSGR